MASKLITISCTLKFQFITRKSIHTAPDLAAILHEKLNAVNLPTQTSNGASIYRVPDHLRSVEPKAYEPNIVSIGPYHHGATHLQAMETTKWSFFQGLFNRTSPKRLNLNAILKELKDMEPQARSCYAEDLNKISSNQFVHMMLVDSCFVIQLLRGHGSSTKLIQRWMEPVIQRDLIMLENQLPMFRLERVYELTNCETGVNESLKELALRFFESMIYKDLDTPNTLGGFTVPGDRGSHFLELFRASICPSEEVVRDKFLVKEPHMFRSMTELKESGVKVKKAENGQPLDASFDKGVLKLATVSMDDYKFTMFRNMVAFEQCHFNCKPHVTTYVFFLDRLINSAEDIYLLHYSGVVQHTLSGNKNAARLVNKPCKEVAKVANDSYLAARLRHEYFYNVWVSLSTIAAILIIYFTILQTISGLPDQERGSKVSEMFGTGFWVSFAKAFAIPFGGFKVSKKVPSKDKFGVFKWFFDYKAHEDMNPLFLMSC